MGAAARLRAAPGATADATYAYLLKALHAARLRDEPYWRELADTISELMSLHDSAVAVERGDKPRLPTRVAACILNENWTLTRARRLSAIGPWALADTSAPGRPHAEVRGPQFADPMKVRTLLESVVSGAAMHNVPTVRDDAKAALRMLDALTHPGVYAPRSCSCDKAAE